VKKEIRVQEVKRVRSWTVLMERKGSQALRVKRVLRGTKVQMETWVTRVPRVTREKKVPKVMVEP
jgi:hypothetical protein